MGTKFFHMEEEIVEKKTVGRQRFSEILGPSAERVLAKLESVSPDLAHYVLGFAYGDLYARGGFADKWRELAAVSCLVGQGNTGLPLKSHLEGMINVGWKKEEIGELLLFLIAYVGFPSIVEAFGVLRELTKSE